jgi:hypothetical protein
MDRDSEFSFRYVSPSIVRGEPYEFCLEYSDTQGTILFSGLEQGHESGGMLNFLSLEDWDELYPTRKGQRELIKARLRKYCRGTPYFSYLDRSLRHDSLYRNVHPFIAGLITGARTSLLTRVGKADLAVATGIALLLLVIVLGTGDPLQFGLWYYLVIPALMIGFGVFLGAPPPYLSGASLAAALSLLVARGAADLGGLVGLGHLFSLPLALAGYVIGVIFARRVVGGMAILALGCLGWGGGFLLTQMLMCRLSFERFFCEFSVFY